MENQERDMLLRHLRRGISLRTQFSGMGCVEQSFAMMTDFIKGLGVELPTYPVLTLEQCDNSRLCQRVLAAFDFKHRSRHVFCDMLERLPEDVLNELKDIDLPRPVKAKGKEMGKKQDQLIRASLVMPLLL